MKLNKLASAILRGYWLIDERSADHLIPIADRFLNGEKVAWFNNPDQEKKEFLSACLIAADNSRQNIKAEQAGAQPANIFSGASEGSIALIPLMGTLMQDDNCGSPGTETLGQWITDAANNPNIIGIALKTNSPGGTVEGTQELADIVAWANTIKPVESWVTGQACSACMWIISPTRITASSGTVEGGSVGTAATYKDYSKLTQIITHYITADESFDKNDNSIQALKGNYQPVKDNIINPTNAIFKNAMITNRGDKLQLSDVKDDQGNVKGQIPLTGQVYLAQKAIDLGLMDAIGNFESVTNSIRSRAASDEFNNSNQSDMSLFNSKFKKLNAIKGKKAAEITEQEIVAVNQELEAEGFDNVIVISSTQMDEAIDNGDAITAAVTSINKSLGLTGDKQHTKLDAALVAFTAAHDKHKADAEKFGAQPGELPSNPKREGNSEGNNGPDKQLTSYEQKMARKLKSTKTDK